MSPRQKETILIGISYLEATYENNKVFLDMLNENVDKDELIYALTSVNKLIIELTKAGVGASESSLELLNKARYIIQNTHN